MNRDNLDQFDQFILRGVIFKDSILKEQHQPFDFFKYIINKKHLKLLKKQEKHSLKNIPLIISRIFKTVGKSFYKTDKSGKICFSSSKFQKKIHHKVLIALAWLGYKIQSLVLWDSKFNESLIETILMTRWSISTMFFSNCKIDDSFAQSIKRLKVENLVHLKLSQNKIGNKGLTQLLKINFKSLVVFELFKTLLTQDIVKVLKKNTFFLAKFTISNLKCNGSRLVFQHQFEFMKSKSSVSLGLLVSGVQFLYLNHIVKTEVNQQKGYQLLINKIRNQEQKQFLFSKSTRIILKQILLLITVTFV